ncbi:MAG: energy-coupled thiamine transporter ThiT [Candidatus Gastranaerophilales bacterium]|nr:energy-coupled thiamine transporter ThiT [Candidatus Gastranaerophilales bacterium]
MSFFFNQEDGYYSLTKAGMILHVCIIVALILLAAFFQRPKTNAAAKKKLFSTKQLVFSAVAIALGFATSYIKLLHMPWGGSVTLCSMLFVVLVGYWYGPQIGLTVGLAYGILQFLQGGGSYILSPLQACMDYILAFAALGLSGLFYKKANGLLKGYLFAVFVRGVFHTIGGYLYWMEYMPDNFPKALAPIYPIAYNYSYLLAEGILTVILLSLPPVKSAMARVKRLATED